MDPKRLNCERRISGASQPFKGAKLRQKSEKHNAPPDKVVQDICRRTRRQYSAEEKISIVLERLRGRTASPRCPLEEIAQSLYYSWFKEFLEADKRRFAGDTVRHATAPEVE